MVSAYSITTTLCNYSSGWNNCAFTVTLWYKPAVFLFFLNKLWTFKVTAALFTVSLSRFRWWEQRVITGGWDFTPTITTAASAGLTTLCSITCPGLSGGRIRSAVIADVFTCRPTKVQAAGMWDLKRLNEKAVHLTRACVCHFRTADWADQKCPSDLPYICKRVNVTGTIPPTPSSPHPPAGCPDGWASYQHKVDFIVYLSCQLNSKQAERHSN